MTCIKSLLNEFLVHTTPLAFSDVADIEEWQIQLLQAEMDDSIEVDVVAESFNCCGTVGSASGGVG